MSGSFHSSHSHWETSAVPYRERQRCASARIGLPDWTVAGRIGSRMLRIEVTQPPAETVAVGYRDPDGSPAVCHNTERASAVIIVSRRCGGRWAQERRWQLDGTAHAEVGLR